MTSIYDSMQALAAFCGTVGGGVVKTAFDLTNIPDQVQRGQIPAMILNPFNGNADLTTLTYMGNAGQVHFTATMLYLHDEFNPKAPRKVSQSLVQFRDTWLAAILANPFINNANHQGPKVKMITDVFRYGDTQYWGIEMTMEFTLNL